jgi:glycosyltransferase involved in cell wall biosynthesis
MNRLYWDADLVLGSFGVGQLDTMAIEAMACGRPIVHHILKTYFPQCPLDEFRGIEEVAERISELLVDEEKAKERCKRQLEYVSNFHAANKLAKKLMKIYGKMHVDD